MYNFLKHTHDVEDPGVFDLFPEARPRKVFFTSALATIALLIALGSASIAFAQEELTPIIIGTKTDYEVFYGCSSVTQAIRIGEAIKEAGIKNVDDDIFVATSCASTPKKIALYPHKVVYHEAVGGNWTIKVIKMSFDGKLKKKLLDIGYEFLYIITARPVVGSGIVELVGDPA